MAKTDYFPLSDPELDEWGDNYVAELPNVAATVNVTPNEEADALAAHTAFKGGLNDVTAKKATLAASVETKNSAKLALFTLLRPLNQRIKATAGYNETIGDQLGINGTDDGFDFATYKPGLKATVFSGNITLEFSKGGTDGVNIYTRLQGEGAWAFLARDTRSPYIDNRPLTTPGQAETREYQCRGVIDDEEIGLMSDAVTGVFGG